MYGPLLYIFFLIKIAKLFIGPSTTHIDDHFAKTALKLDEK